MPDGTGDSTVTVIVHHDGRTVGLVVDAVSEVVALDPAGIRPRPGVGGQPDAELVVGFAQRDTASGRLLQLMDLASLLRDL